MMTIANDYQQQKNAGNSKKLEDYPGFHAPYNTFFWALVHVGIPFNFERQGVTQGLGSVEDLVVTHPLALADGATVEQYKSMPAPPPLPSSLLHVVKLDL